jgi:hypothetical protein
MEAAMSDAQAIAARLTAIAERLKAATPGEWSWEDDGDQHTYGQTRKATLYADRGPTAHGLNLLGRLEPDANGFNNLQFIANAPADIRFLLAHVETLERELNNKFGGDALVIEAREGEKRMLAKLEDCLRNKYTSDQQRLDNARREGWQAGYSASEETYGLFRANATQAEAQSEQKIARLTADLTAKDEQAPHGPTIQEAQAQMATLADHYGHGWLAGREALERRLAEAEQARDTAQAALKALADRHAWTPGMGRCICEPHIKADELLHAALAASAPLHAHEPNCNSWRGVSAHPESEPLPCDCRLSLQGE